MFIREATPKDTTLLARIISDANRDVAIRFALTAENCPKHPSFCTSAWIAADLARGERYFVLADDSLAPGCVAFENPSPGLAYLNRLSVLPSHQNRGFGTRLVHHIFAVAKTHAIATISIGVIGEHHELQSWYRRLGFQDGDCKHFPHLPFSVKYMFYTVH